MLSSIHILSLNQGKLYGERISIEALPRGFRLPRPFAVLVTLAGRWRKRRKKAPPKRGRR